VMALKVNGVVGAEGLGVVRLPAMRHLPN
jgi:hypothetical protein